MFPRCRVLAALVVLLLAFSPLSAGCPHFQGWLLGNSDSDLDDAASLVGAGLADSFLLCGSHRPPVPLEFLWPNGDRAAPNYTPTATPTRGPPIL
jgi:hypothetical protein